MRKFLAAALAAAVTCALIWNLPVQADVNPMTAKKDPSAEAYWDTTFTVTSSTKDTLTFGFNATKVTIDCMTVDGDFACRIFGAQNTLRNAGNGSASNPRTGITVVDGDSLAITAPSGGYVSKVYDADGSPLFYGLGIYGSETVTVIVTAVRARR